MNFSDLAGHGVALWGFGREGRSVARKLDSLGLAYVVAEPEVASGAESGVLYDRAGREALLAAEVVIKSPGVPVTSAIYRELVERKIAVTSLTDLWLNGNADRTIAVTGSKGKSTTASLIHHILTQAGLRSSLRGNIGTSVLDEESPPADIVVMELSSYQAQSVTVSPRIVVVTSLFPEHLTWHGSEAAYYADKLNVIAHGPRTVVTKGDDPHMLTLIREHVSPGTQLHVTGTDTVQVEANGGLRFGDGTHLAADHLPLLGRHQAENIALAALVAVECGEQPAAIAQAIRTFIPLPHRLERVESSDGRTWIDDSLATAPHAVVASLQALPARAVAVIVGGADRGLDFTPLMDYLESRPEVTLLLVGPAGERIVRSHGRGTRFASFGDAVAWARSEENVADTVLLSPGAPSFDEFVDYEARSAVFRAAASG